MRYEYVPYDDEHYSSNLRFNENRGTLLWDSAPRQDALLVQGPFRKDMATFMEQFCKDTDAPIPKEGQFYFIKDGVYIRFVSAAERARNNGCALNGRACTYTVFSCDWETDIDAPCCRIYAPLRRPMNPVSCDIPRRVQATVREVKENPGFFQGIMQMFSRNGQQDSNFYRISFQTTEGSLDDTLENGDLFYRTGKFTYPILKEMMRGGFYVRSHSKPEICSRNPGLSVEVRSTR